MNRNKWLSVAAFATLLVPIAPGFALAAEKPNILLIVSDDTGWGDLGPYLGGEARGMQTPNFDKLASEGMFFTNFYGQPSCTPGRAAIQTVLTDDSLHVSLQGTSRYTRAKRPLDLQTHTQQTELGEPLRCRLSSER